VAAYQVLLLNTAVPQIQAAQSGDTYVVPRDIAFSTVASFAAGTAAAPSIVATGDVNTGIWFPAADTIAASTGGSEQMRLTSTGLGIGTSSPVAKLDVRSSGTFTGDPQASFYDTRAVDANIGGGINFGGTFTGTTVTTWAGISGLKENATDGNFAGSLTFFTRPNGSGAVERMRIDSSGNLGLGVTPSAWSGLKAFEFAGVGSSLASASNNNLFLSANAWYNGTNWRYGITAAASQYQSFGGAHAWYTAPSGTAGNAITFTQAMTLDASGNLGVGTTSPNSYGINSRVIHVDGGANASEIKFTNSTSGSSGANGLVLQLNGNDAYLWNGENSFLSFGTNNTERARITSGGNFCVGATSELIDSGRRFSSVGGSVAGSFKVLTTSDIAVEMWNSATSGDNIFSEFKTEASPTFRGSITYNRAGGLVAYNITSDYRAKDILGPVANPGATIDALKVYNGKMKGATVERPMLVAHEAQAVAPYSVTGEKDAVNDDGTPKYQQMDVSSLVPLLIAEIQSLRARVAQLEQGN
jgi:hypothetical protein